MLIGTGATWRPWTTVALLFAAQTINRADKVVLGMAATAVMAELHLSAEQYGIVASSFYSLYAVAGLVVGLLFAHRYRPRIILAVLLAVWSLAQLPIVFAASFATLIASRALLGMGEGNGTPTLINACHEWFPAEKRNMPTAIVIVAGAMVGGLIAAPALSWVIDHFGWRAAFAACAVAGGVVLALWLLFGRDGPYSGIATRTHAQTSTPKAAFRHYANRTVVGNFILCLCAEWVGSFMIAWLAPFMSLQLGFTRMQTGWMLSGVFLAMAVLSVAVAALSQMMLTRGSSSRTARAIFNGALMIAAVPCFITAAYASDPYVRLVAVGLAVGLPQITFTLNPALLSAFFPAEHRNRLLHVFMASINLGALVSPWAAGRILDHAGPEGWTTALLVNAGVALLGGMAAIIFINPARSAGEQRPASMPSNAAATSDVIAEPQRPA